jgi:WD40 repeat protein
VNTGEELMRYPGITAKVMSASFSPDGKRFLSCSYAEPGDAGNVRLWEVDSGKELRRFRGEAEDVIYSVAFSPDGRHALTNGGPGFTLRLWDVETGEEVRRFSGHTDWPTQVAFSPDGRRALSGSRDNTVRLWDVASGQELGRFPGHTNTVNGVTFSPDGLRALSGSTDGTLRLWRLPDPPPPE